MPIPAHRSGATVIVRRASTYAIVFLAAALAATSAHAESLICRFDPGPSQHFIAPEVRLDLVADDRVKVRDAVISSTDRDGVFGDVVTNDASRLSVMWEVTNLETSDGDVARFRNSHIIVRLSVQKPGGEAAMNVLDVTRYLNVSFRAEGRCQLGE